MAVKILSPRVRDQIAAGEVVERPSSVVKELVENSLDAGARRVSVELEEGGRRLIRVVDDGCGMDRADLELCVERFATSKLSDTADLTGLATLGFRGEALPSVASVSRLVILTRRRDAESAWRLAVEGGVRTPPEPAGAPPGTTAEVRDLFFNVPARMKFLKSGRTELSRAMAVLSDLALARPDVAFALEHDGRVLLDLPAAERLADRVAAIHGTEVVEGLAEVELRLPAGARAAGLVGLPVLHRQRAEDIHVFVGGRPVRDRTVTAAVNAAYSGLLPLRCYPVVFLFLDFPAGEVDVNVHPAKAEVRFARPGEVFALVERAVRSALAAAELAAAGGPAEYGAPASEPLPRGAAEAPVGAASRPYKGAKRPTQAAQPRLDLWRGPPPHDAPATAAPPSAPAAQCAAARTESGGAAAAQAAPAAQGQPPADDAGWRYLGQALDSFLLVERGDGLLVVDQHALHERLIFEDLRAARSAAGAAASQGLVIPQTVEMSRQGAETLRASRAELAALGFDIEDFGPAAFMVRAVPAALRLSDLAGYMVELAGALAEGDLGEAKRSEEVRRERLLAAVACKAAVKAGERLSPGAAHDLLRRAFSRTAGGTPHTCPHGRPTCFLLDRAELARRVGRPAGQV